MNKARYFVSVQVWNCQTLDPVLDLNLATIARNLSEGKETKIIGYALALSEEIALLKADAPLLFKAVL
jgi:hypothetical protein